MYYLTFQQIHQMKITSSIIRLPIRICATLVAPAVVSMMVADIQAQTWNQTAAGTGYNWQTTTNWTPNTVPNGVDAVASLTNNIAGAQTISLNGTVTLGTLNIGDSDGTHAFTLQNGTVGSLNFDVTSGNAAIHKTSGSAGDAISATIILNDNLVVTNSATAKRIAFNGSIGEGSSGKSITFAGGFGDLNNANNSFTGGVNLTGGVRVDVVSIANSGTNSSLGKSGTISLGDGANAAILGFVNLSANMSTDRTLDLASTTGGASILNSAANAVKFTGDFTASGAGNKTLTIRGTNAGGNEISGAIVDNSAMNTTSIRKIETGTWILSGNSSYTGGVAALNGILSFTSVADTGTNSALGAAGRIQIGASTSGTLNYIGTGNSSSNRTVNLTATTTESRINANGSGTLKFTSDITASGVGSKLLTLGGNNTGANEISGAIADNSVGNTTALNKADAGTWILSGNNTHSGHTKISAGTLILNNSLALQNSALDTLNSIAGNATAGLKITVTTLTLGGLTGDKNLSTVFNTTSGGYGNLTALTINPGTGVSNSYSGNIIDGAVGMTLTKTGEGTQILLGNNTYTGGTTVSAGTLIGTTSSLQGSIINNAAVTFDQITDGAYAGTMSGTGSLTKNGSGTVTLSSINTFTGLTKVSAGNLALSNSLALQNSTLDTLNSIAGTSTDGLKTTVTSLTLGGLTGDKNLSAVFNTTSGGYGNLTALTINPGTGFSNSYSGNITDGAAGMTLTKTGDGTQILSGSNTHSGGTIVSSGILSVGKYNALGTGDLTFNNGSLYVYSSQQMAGHVQVGENFLWNNGKISYFYDGESPGSQDLKMVVAGNLTNGGAGGMFDFAGVQALDKGAYTLVAFNGSTNFSPTQFKALAGPTTTLIGTFTVTNGSVIYNLEDAICRTDAQAGYYIQNKGGPNTPVIANYIVDTATITVNPVNKIKTLIFESNGNLDIEAGGKLFLSKGTLTVNDGASTITGGALVAESDLNKDGIGTLDVKTDLVVTVQVNVNEGLLAINGQASAREFVVNPLGTLGGAGLIISNVRNTGVVAPGNSPGTLRISGNYEQASSGKLNIEIASTSNFDRLVVSGQMTIAGTLTVIPYNGMKLEYGQTYDIIEAGSITGAFDSIVVPDNLRARFLNLGTIGLLVFGPSDFSNIGLELTGNQESVAKALNEFLKSSDKDRQTVVAAFDSLTIEQFPAAFDQIMPGFYESLANIAIEQAFAQTQMLNQRISSVRLGAAGFQAIGGITQPLVHDKNGKSAADAKDASPIVESATTTNWNAWALGTGMFSRSTNLGSLQNYNNDAGGFLVGADYRWSENFVTGLYGGYDYSYAEYNGGGSTKGNSFSFGTYASYAKDGYYADAVIGGGYTGFQTQRSIEFSTIDRTASADPNSGQFTAGLNLGKDFEVGKFTLGPIVGAQYTYAGIGSFTESGAESLDLSLGQQNANSLRSTLGGRIAYTWNLNQKIALIPEVRMFWQHEFLNNSRNINAALDGGNGPSFDYETSDPYRNSVFAGAGVTAQFGKNLSGSVFYNINFGSQTYQSNMVSAGLNFSF